MIEVGAAVPLKFQNWYRIDAKHAEEWRKAEKQSFDYVAGRQWDDKTLKILREQMRPSLTFNRLAPVVDSVVGQQIANRQEVRFLPREPGDVKANELLTGAAEWFRDEAEADDEDSQAFGDCVIGGMGWTETWLDYEEDDEGKPRVDRVSPFEMVWDANSKRRNLTDKKRVWRVRTLPLEEAREMFPDYDDRELNAHWVMQDTSEEPYNATEPRDRLAGRDGGDETEQKQVVIVQCQWIGTEVRHVIADPLTGEQQELSEQEHRVFTKRAKQMGMRFPSARRKRKVYRQAFLGGVVLASGDAPCPKGFTLQCITGKRDQTKNQWYGLVRPMLDPQQWANKWLSQMLHIMNGLAKGGTLVESDAIPAGQADSFKESWARHDAVTVVAPGALANGKITPKPVQSVPPHLMQMTEFAISSIRDVVGVNLEMMGMREANQPGVLEYQRRQSGMTVLQWLFDAFRKYRRTQGKVILHYLQNDLSDGRLVRIVGQEGEQYVPLMREADLEYDIVVDEAPQSPNYKERTWQLLTAILPQVRDMVTPEVMLKLLEFSPLPSSVVASLREMAEAGEPQQQQMAAMQARKIAAEIGKDEASAAESMADAQKAAVEAQVAAMMAMNPAPATEYRQQIAV